MKYNLLWQKFGRLTVIESAGANSHREHLWKCKCECGNEKIINAYALVSGHTKSCGCLAIDTSRILNTKHGERDSRLYRIYTNMKSRCYKENSSNYKYYGGRGIRVCEEWLGKDGAYNFCKWAKSNGYSDNLTLDRIDNNAEYSPSNCRWITWKQQQNNKRNNVKFSYKGQTKTMAEWADHYGIKYSTFQRMLKQKEFFEVVREIESYG